MGIRIAGWREPWIRICYLNAWLTIQNYNRKPPIETVPSNGKMLSSQICPNGTPIGDGANVPPSIHARNPAA